MAYCAVGLKTESGDDYTVLVEYRHTSDISSYLADILDEDMSYVSSVQVDSGVDSNLDDFIENLIWEKVNSVEEED